MKNVVNQFSNYPAFEYNFHPVIIEKVGRNDYIVYQDNESYESYKNWIQRGTKEYINGWLYGAVQAACGQVSAVAPAKNRG